MRCLFPSIAIGASVLALSTPAQAAQVTQSFAFYATSFFDASYSDPADSPNSVPLDPVVGRVTFRYDNSTDVQATTNGLFVSGFNLPYVGVAKFAYNKYNDLIFFGTDVSPTSAGISSRLEFVFTFSNISTTPIADLAYAPAGPGIFLSGSVNLTPLLSAVPEPANWALMIGGFGLVGGTIRRRNSQATTVRAAYS